MSSEHIYEKGDGPYRGFGYSSLFSDQFLQNKANEIYCNFATFNRVVHTKTSIIKIWPNININFLISQNTLSDLKRPKGKCLQYE